MGDRNDQATADDFTTPLAHTYLQGEADAPGLCTIQILNLLQEIQNEVIAQLVSLRPSPVSDGGGGGTVEAKGQEPGEGGSPPLIPPTSYLTPAKVLLRQLVIYDQGEDLIPLLTTFADRDMDYGRGGLKGYDLLRVEQSLAQTLLATAKPMVLQIIHYQYSGELRRTDRLQKLRDRVAQEELPRSILDTIWVEIDTQNRLRRLLNQIEVCIGFLVSIGGSAVRRIDGATKLQVRGAVTRDYAAKILLGEDDSTDCWKGGSPPSGCTGDTLSGPALYRAPLRPPPFSLETRLILMPSPLWPRTTCWRC
jgi:hypothetical protein